jgi:simple sugar transport system permease protein
METLSSLQVRQRRGIIAMLLLSLFFTYVFFLNSKKTESVTFGFILGDEWKLFSEWNVNSKSGALIFLIISFFGVAISYLLFKQKKKITIGSFLFGFGSAMAFLCWVAAGKFIPFTGLLQGAIMLSNRE